MTKRLAGVALAAMVGACALAGGTQRAEAALYYGASIRFFGESDQGSIRGAFQIPADNSSAGFGEIFYGSNPRVEISDISNFEIGLNAPSVPGTGFSFESKQGHIEGNYNGYANAYNYLNTSYFSGYDVTYYNFDLYSVGSVPLPSSAPLFGIGLFALGSVAYARRRVLVSLAA